MSFRMRAVLAANWGAISQVGSSRQTSWQRAEGGNKRSREACRQKPLRPTRSSDCGRRCSPLEKPPVDPAAADKDSAALPMRPCALRSEQASANSSRELLRGKVQSIKKDTVWSRLRRPERALNREIENWRPKSVSYCGYLSSPKFRGSMLTRDQGKHMFNPAEGRFDVCVVGGAGHVGAPLAMVMASRGLRTLIYDINPAAMEKLAAGEMPFFEQGGESLLKQVLANDSLCFSSDVSDVRDIPYIVLTVGTPIDEFHNPVLRSITDCVDALLPYISNEQTVILRSTVFPGVTDFLARYLESHG